MKFSFIGVRGDIPTTVNWPVAFSVPGQSAYEAAVNNGFTGTEADWLASLVGAIGPKGEDGIPGSTGPAGADGIPGSTGPAGADGTNAIITVFTNQAAYDAYVPAANEIAILNE